MRHEMLVVVVVLFSGLIGGKQMNQQKVPDLLLDEFLSTDEATANHGATLIFKAGANMLPALVSLRGNRHPFAGSVLYNPRASIVYPVAGQPGLTESQAERATTAEIAALYLICAIYYQDLHFAHGVLLTDLNTPRSDRKAGNSAQFLSRAWEAVDAWAKEVYEASIEAMRARRHSPLATARLAWY